MGRSSGCLSETLDWKGMILHLMWHGHGALSFYQQVNNMFNVDTNFLLCEAHLL